MPNRKSSPSSPFVSKMPPPTEDRISALPDEILRYILSFLPTKFAFTTSVLSKRWTPICYSLPVLHFDDENEEDKEIYGRFRRFVDAVLLSPSFQHHPIKTLSLKSMSRLSWEFYMWESHSHRSGSTVDEWVQAAKQRGVENLHLSTSFCLLQLSPSIFAAKTLVVLKLGGITMENHVESVDLPSLRTLHLSNVLFRNRDDLKKILNGCPLVEDLIALARNFEPGYITGFKTLPKVVKACINAFNVPLSAVNNVEFLRIEEMHRTDKDKFINSYYKAMPVFRNLISIELSFNQFPSWDAVVEVLPYCPKLQSLAIEKVEYKKFYKKEWAYAQPAAECVSLHLTTCSIENYQIRGRYDDFDFAAYILQNARVLQALTLYIDPYCDCDESEKDQFFQELSQCPRISPACKIECK